MVDDDSLPLITAVTPRWESELAARLDRSGQVHLVRRCADLAELLGSVDAGLGRIAVISPDVPGVDRGVVAHVLSQGVLLLGVHAPGDEDAVRRLHRYGVEVTVAADAELDALETALDLLTSGSASAVDTLAPIGDLELGEAPAGMRGLSAVEEAEPPGGGVPGPPRTPVDAPPPEPPREAGDDREIAAPTGKVIAVWGTAGAPGRTTTAVNLAVELSAVQLSAEHPPEGSGRAVPVVLLDADTHAASIAQSLAMLDEAPGMAAAARAADHGTLDSTRLLSLAPQVMPGLSVLTGLPRADRWPELGDHAVADIITAAREVAAWTVIDCASSIEQDEEVTYDTRAPRRNGATLTALENADQIVLVGAADPVGLQRLVRAAEEVQDVSSAPVLIVVTKVRASAVGSDPRGRVERALYRFAGIQDALLIPDDRAGLDAALLAGRALREVRHSSPARQGYRTLAQRLSPTAGSRSTRAGHLRGGRWRRGG